MQAVNLFTYLDFLRKKKTTLMKTQCIVQTSVDSCYRQLKTLERMNMLICPYQDFVKECPTVLNALLIQQVESL